MPAENSRNSMEATSMGKSSVQEQVTRAAAARQALADAGFAGAEGLLSLISGKKELGEASRDAAVDFAVRQAGRYAEDGLNKILEKSVASCSNKMLQNVAAAEIPVPVVQFVREGTSCVVKFFKGDLTGDECLDNLADLSVTALGGTALTAVAAELAPGLSVFAVGGVALLPMAAMMLGGAIASGIYTGLKTYLERDARIAEERERRITKYCREACRQLRDYRRQIDHEFKKTNKAFYDLMAESLVDLDSGDASLILEGGNRILQAFGREPLARTVAEFDCRMTNDLDVPLVIGRRR